MCRVVVVFVGYWGGGRGKGGHVRGSEGAYCKVGVEYRNEQGGMDVVVSFVGRYKQLLRQKAIPTRVNYNRKLQRQE
jgi:hypothetical protein